MNESPTIVYHYCSLETFLKIISNKTIRLTNISKSNDKEEIRHCFPHFSETLKVSCINFANKYIANPEVKKEIENIDYGELVQRAVDNDHLLYYAACFSSKSDSFGLWLNYANNGKGVAIGFRTKYFAKAVDLNHMMYGKVSYEMSDTKAKLREYIEEKMRNAFPSDGVSLTYSVYSNIIGELTRRMVYGAAFYKKSAFRDESEYRLVYYPFGNIIDFSEPDKLYDRMVESMEAYPKDYCGMTLGNLRFNSTEDMIVSYFDMDFSKTTSIIKEIVVGPKSNLDDHDLRLFLISNGYDISRIKIRVSSATNR